MERRNATNYRRSYTLRIAMPYRPLVIGLVNNMSLAAMPSIRGQFASMLESARRPAELVCFTMRTDRNGVHDHLPIDTISDYAPDAIIVTGMEVTAKDLQDEWIWQRFTRLYDWCERQSIPAIWSCLAAHAAVLFRDGIVRQPLGEKLSGVFDCEKAVSTSKLLKGLPQCWRFPHSRFNGLDDKTLMARGYTVLSHGNEIGVDIFTHKDSPASFYFQGHPEYRAETLLHEFFRDLRRFAAGESQHCPSVPKAYLSSKAEKELLILLEQAHAGNFDASCSYTLRDSLHHHWADTATQLISNWLDIVAEHTDCRADMPVLKTALSLPGTISR
ncbi:MAG: homoserine O-succinyltransferase [Rhodospirillales bacterium]|nr:homoserine O-succinyltransferase [Rhodospirillales bacterium]